MMVMYKNYLQINDLSNPRIVYEGSRKIPLLKSSAVLKIFLFWLNNFLIARLILKIRLILESYEI